MAKHASRRAVLALAAASGALAAAGPAGEYTELLAACAEFDALEQRIKALCTGPETAAREAALDAAIDAQAPLLERICRLRATTLAGLRARARTMLLYEAANPADAECSGACVDKRMIAALIRDLTAGDRA